MQTLDKFKLWVALLLVWNAGLLVLTLVLLLVAKNQTIDAQSIANDCAAAAQQAVETQCSER